MLQLGRSCNCWNRAKRSRIEHKTFVGVCKTNNNMLWMRAHLHGQTHIRTCFSISIQRSSSWYMYACMCVRTPFLLVSLLPSLWRCFQRLLCAISYESNGRLETLSSPKGTSSWARDLLLVSDAEPSWATELNPFVLINPSRNKRLLLTDGRPVVQKQCIDRLKDQLTQWLQLCP